MQNGLFREAKRQEALFVGAGLLRINVCLRLPCGQGGLAQPAFVPWSSGYMRKPNCSMALVMAVTVVRIRLFDPMLS